MPLKILIVDDHQAARAGLKLLLQDLIEVESASPGTFFEACSGQHDAALFDVRIPGADGLSLLRKVREAQMLRHVGLGLSNREIALSLDISVETVKEHVQKMLRKIPASDRTEAAVKAVRLGLVDF